MLVKNLKLLSDVYSFLVIPQIFIKSLLSMADFLLSWILGTFVCMGPSSTRNILFFFTATSIYFL